MFIPRDPSALGAIPPGVSVIRTGFIKVALPVSAAARLLPSHWRVGFNSFFSFPDFNVGWLPFLLPTLRNLLDKGKEGQRYDAVWTTSPPPSVHLAGVYIKRRYEIPWVVDFRDPWLDNPVLKAPTRLHRAFHASLERRVLQGADQIVANTEGNKRRLLLRYPHWSEKIHVIPNGYEEGEFAGLEAVPRFGHRMLLCHAGTLFPTYDPRPLFAGLALAIRRLPRMRDEVCVKLFGNRSERSEIARWGLVGVVEEYPWQPRRVILQELAASDVTVLCMSGSRGTDFWVPAKTYTYLRIGKPVLALVPRGEAREILERAGIGRTCDANDAAQIADALQELFEDWKAGRLQVTPVEEVTEQYEAGTLTARLARILDAVVHEHEGALASQGQSERRL
jgi:glycosyltransferase involved in cell wall biosynthesis